MAKYCILGAGSVFGNLTARYLLRNGHEVVAIGRNPLKPHFHLGVGDGQKYSYHQIHLVTQKPALYDLLDSQKPDYIVNFAALAYANSWDDPSPYYNTNMMMVVDLIEHLRKVDYLKRFIQIGSSEIYGSTSSPAREDSPVNPTSPYAVSKLAADLHLISMKSKLPVNIIRPSNCYGEGQYTYRIIPKAILYLLNGKPFPLEGGGVAEKSFMYADDLASAIEAIAEKGREGEVYNVGSDVPVSMKQIVLEICRQMDKPEFTHETQGRPIEDSKYWIDSTKIKALGWYAKTPLEDGISHMVDWCKAYEKELLNEPDYFVLRP